LQAFLGQYLWQHLRFWPHLQLYPDRSLCWTHLG
jgi:hypothetical protein